MGLDMYIVDEMGDEVAYWRKFNALHRWFVTHLQDGVDDCQRSRQIMLDDAEALLYILKEIHKNPVVADGLMPTVSGFFFGSTNYDDYFMDDIKQSIPVIEDLIQKIKWGDKLYYHSSW
jgi:hypothetical protein